MIFIYLLHKLTFIIKTGDTVKGVVRPPKEGESFFHWYAFKKINDMIHVVRDRVSFEHLTPVFFHQKNLNWPKKQKHCFYSHHRFILTNRKGTAWNGLPTKNGKTMLLKEIANALLPIIPKFT
jgi:transcription termination factor Rho